MSNKFLIFLFLLIDLGLLFSACRRLNDDNKIDSADRFYKIRNDLTFNSMVAEKDIKNGQIKYIYNGLPPYISYLSEQDSVAKKYGFQIIFFSHGFIGEAAKGIEEYNETVSDYLTNRSGKGWKIKFDKEVELMVKREDSIYNAKNTTKNY